MSSAQKSILRIDMLCILITGFFFLFISPSIEGRPDLVFLPFQIFMQG